MHNKDNKKFYYHGKFFEDEKEFLAYAKEWPFLETDTETFERQWNHLGKEIWMNVHLRGIKMTNGALNEILHENLIYLFDKVFKTQLVSKDE